MTPDEWIEDDLPDPSTESLLQMDIEGFEYESVLSASRSLMERLRIIVIEFHGLDLLRSQPFFSLASSAFEKILQTTAARTSTPTT